MFWRMACGCLGIVMTLGALFLLADPINVVAYYLGYGEDIRVEVTQGTNSTGPGRDSILGTGRVIGENRTVNLYDASDGDVVTARPRLIDTGAKKYVFHGNRSVLSGLTSIIGVFLLGTPGVLLLLMGFAPVGLLVRLEPLMRRLTRALEARRHDETR